MADDDKKHHGLSGVGTFFIVLIVLILLGIAGWVVFTHLRARRLGLPPPTLSSYIPFKSSSSRNNFPAPAPGGVVGWFNDKIRAFRNRQSRTADGAYEGTLHGGRGRRSNRGFGALDPDEAWDARVGNEADVYEPGGYYEEQELGLHGGGVAPYGGSGYAGHSASTPLAAPTSYDEDDTPRGRSRSREAPVNFVGGTQRGLDERYDEEMGTGRRHDPFGDTAERSDMSMRGVSPRPVDTSGHHQKASQDDSPTERRSMFKENM
ncbi:MAG: hypothetical protein M4579_006389 [Chaenotheca gracillima]|nr:MAG: hypothetical protein M4579_006389 [Chaenotheca gracillima]